MACACAACSDFDLEFRACGLRFRAYGLGFRVPGLGFRVRVPKASQSIRKVMAQTMERKSCAVTCWFIVGFSGISFTKNTKAEQETVTFSRHVI